MTDTDQTEGTDEMELRAWAAKLFAPAEDDETAETDDAADETGKPQGNVVPKEGNISQPKDDSDKQFVRDLFN